MPIRQRMSDAIATLKDTSKYYDTGTAAAVELELYLLYYYYYYFNHNGSIKILQ